ncbi:glycosyltransferase [Lamprobacter modestohalophilus]|uniref:glycosyltransferase n=1 Tax=Lamprobacter modestohalophilus TaxID=1064514 RepID=UPI002ADEC482|nr:glycosyltransferase [Lamprobacter modestohalophilus]MEA1052142.1 glycosyltransferase [Lamprobacter modestohalophilus]
MNKANQSNSKSDFSPTTGICGQLDLIKEAIAQLPDKGRLIDLGTGAGLAARHFHDAGWDVTATGFDMGLYLADNEPLPEAINVLPDLDICDMHPLATASYDAVWCAHVLEHISNTGQALSEIRRILKPDGTLCVTVPPFKHQVVGGHVNCGWNIGTLMYVLADAGFDLADARFVRHGYHVFGIVRRGQGPLSKNGLHRANGDIEKLVKAGRFPKGFIATQGFDGNLPCVNWRWAVTPTEIPVWRGQLGDVRQIPQMAIGFFVPWITKSRGGTENVGQMMANAMVARGHVVVIFTFDDDRGPSRWPLDERIGLVHLPERQDEPADQAMMVEVASRNLDLLVGLHMNRTLLRYVKCAHKVGLPVVLSEHIDPTFPNLIGAFPEEERVLALSGATLVHLLVEAFRPTVPRYLGDRVRVIPNTIAEPAELAQPNAEKEFKTVLTVARLVSRKNTALLLNAFALIAHNCPDWRLCILGDGPERDALTAQAKTLGLSESVDFVGHQDNTYPFYRDADLFVIPSLYEGFGLTLCEALAHALPSVGFALCNGVNEQILDGKNGFLIAGEPSAEALAEKMQTLMQNRNLRSAMSAGAWESFRARYSNKRVHDAWEQIFAEAYAIGPRTAKLNEQQIARLRLQEAIWGRQDLRYLPRKKA